MHSHNFNRFPPPSISPKIITKINNKMKTNQKHPFGSFVPMNRLNLNKKIILLENPSNDDEPKERELLAKDRLKELQTSLNDAVSLKNDGKHHIDGVALTSVIEQRQADIVEFLKENRIVPSDKGFSVICDYVDHSTNLPKEFPKFGIDFVFSDEQERILNGLKQTDKAWLSSEKGNQSEKEFLGEMSAKGSIGKRAFSIFMKEGKPRIKGGYQIESDFDDDLEKKFFERQNQKNHFGLLANTEEKSIEEKTCKELRLECKSLGISSKGKKAELVNRITANS